MEGREFHCGRMVRMLRAEHQAALVKVCIQPHRALRYFFDDSAYRRAMLIDGELSALGGVTGPAIASTGTIWLAITERATRYPHLITRVCLRQLREVLKIKLELDTFILPADETSLRFAKMMGFVTLRNSGVDAKEGEMVPMLIRRNRKTSYGAAHAAMH